MKNLIFIISGILFLPVISAISTNQVKVYLQDNPIYYYIDHNAKAILIFEKDSIPLEGILNYSIKSKENRNLTSILSSLKGGIYINLSENQDTIEINLGNYSQPINITIDLEIKFNGLNFIFENVTLGFVTNTLLLEDIESEDLSDQKDLNSEYKYISSGDTGKRFSTRRDIEKRLEYIQKEILPINSDLVTIQEINEENRELTLKNDTKVFENIAILLEKLYNDSLYIEYEMQLKKEGYIAIYSRNYTDNKFTFIDIIFSNKEEKQKEISAKFLNETLINVYLDNENNNLIRNLIIIFFISVIVAFSIILYLLKPKLKNNYLNENHFGYIKEIKLRFKNARNNLKEEKYFDSCLWLGKAVRLYISYNEKIQFFINNKNAIKHIQEKPNTYDDELIQILEFCRDVVFRNKAFDKSMIKNKLDFFGELLKSI